MDCRPTCFWRFYILHCRLETLRDSDAGADDRPAAPPKKKPTTSRAKAAAGAASVTRATNARGRKPATAPAWAKPVLEIDQFAQAVGDGVVFAKMAGYSHWPAQVRNTLQCNVMISHMQVS